MPSKTTPKRGRGRPSGSVKITIDDVAVMHGFPTSTVYGWTRQMCRDGKPVLPAKKYGHLVRVLTADALVVTDRLTMRLPRRRPSFFSQGSDGQGGDDD